jgi:hypothetical protein
VDVWPAIWKMMMSREVNNLLFLGFLQLLLNDEDNFYFTPYRLGLNAKFN